MTSDSAVPPRPDVAPRPHSPESTGRPDRATTQLPAAVFALALCTFAIGTTEFAGIGLLSEIADGVGVSQTRAGALISAYAIGVVIGAPTMIALGTKAPRRALMLALMTLFVVGNLASAAAPGYAWLFAARIVTALPHGAVFGLGAVIATHLSAPSRRNAAISATFMGLTVSTFLGAPASTLIGQQLGWRTAFVVIAAVGVLGVVALVATMPPVPRPADVTLRAEGAALLTRPVLGLLLAATIGFAGVFAALGYLAPILHEVSGFAPSSAVWGLAVFGLGSTTGNLLSPRIQRRAVTVQESNTLMIYVLGVLVVLLLAFSATAHVPILAVINVFAIGAVGFLLAPLVQGQLLDLAGDAPTLSSAALHSAFNAGNAIGPLVGGLVVGAGFAYASAAGAGLSAIGLLIAMLRRRQFST